MLSKTVLFSVEFFTYEQRWFRKKAELINSETAQMFFMFPESTPKNIKCLATALFIADYLWDFNPGEFRKTHLRCIYYIPPLNNPRYMGNADLACPVNFVLGSDLLKPKQFLSEASDKD